MAWVSPKVYAILSNSEEGKDILEGIGEKTQDEVDKELDAFFGNGGKGESSSEDYKKAKDQDEVDRKSWESQNDMDDEDYERAWGPKDDEDEDDDGEVSDDDISEALADFQWQITDGETVGEYAASVADKLGIDKDRVLNVIRNEDANIKETDNMAKVAGLEPEEDDEKIEDMSELEKKHQAFLEEGKSTWNQTLHKGDKVVFEDRDGNDVEAYVKGFWWQGDLVDEDTYEEGKDNLWHDFRGVGIVDKDGKMLGSINAFQIKKHEKGNQ